MFSLNVKGSKSASLEKMTVKEKFKVLEISIDQEKVRKPKS